MKILVTGSAGHLLARRLEGSAHEALGLDIRSSPFARCVGSITERDFVRRCMAAVDAVVHGNAPQASHRDS